MSKARNLADLLDSNGDVVSGALDSQPQLGRRNLIINGGFKVSQRGDYSSATSITSGTYYIDRWKFYTEGVTGTVQQTDVTINGVSKKAAKIVATSSGTGYIGLLQKIELTNIPVGETVTASCYVRSNNSNTRFRANSLGGTNTDGTAFTNDGNWEKVTWTFETTGTVTNPALWVITYDSADVSVTSGDYIEVTDFQLELGSVATPFEHRSYGEELALCQRYYQRIGAESLSGASAGDRGIIHAHLWGANNPYWVHHFMTPMRSGPTFLISTTPASLGVWYSAGNTSTPNNNFRLMMANTMRAEHSGGLSTNFSAGGSAWFRLNANQWIAYDAEL
jgi:hypothetical protein